MCEGNPSMQEASILSIRLCLNVKHKSGSFHVYVSNESLLLLTYFISVISCIKLETRTKEKLLRTVRNWTPIILNSTVSTKKKPIRCGVLIAKGLCKYLELKKNF